MGVESALASVIGAESAAAVFSGLSTLGTIGTVVGGVSSVAGGISASQEAKRQASLAEFQAQQKGQEEARLAQAKANEVARTAEETRKAQKMAYLKSGVTLEGSPLLTMEGTRVQGQQNVEEIMRAGGAAVGASTAEGRIQAANLRSAGRQAFVSGLSGGAQMFKSAFGSKTTLEDLLKAAK